jgi:predicted dehydrogenase
MGSVPLVASGIKISQAPKEEALRMGIIGCGSRGEALMRIAAAHLHIQWVGICEVYDARLKKGLSIAGKDARGYKNYLELLDREELDAVIIATPDHWHARMAIDAARRGIHIYLEKCMTRTLAEAFAVREAVRRSGVVFQLGHQGRQRDLNHKARALIEKGTLGEISLVETTTNRNDSPLEWGFGWEGRATADSVDWELFQGSASGSPGFSRDRYYGWRRYWDYSTGMSGDLFSNEYDAVNSILDLGIPKSVMASGGIYHHEDGREVPDVFQAVFEYPDRHLTLLYSGTLASGIPRGTLFMGRDATLELGRALTVWADRYSSKYKGRIESAIIDPSTPFVRYETDRDDVDAVSSPTTKYYADRGLIDTYRDGQKVNATHLHLAEWLFCIRSGGIPSCHVERGFEEAVTAHMATLSYREGRKVQWQAQSEAII